MATVQKSNILQDMTVFKATLKSGTATLCDLQWPDGDCLQAFGKVDKAVNNFGVWLSGP